MMSVYAQADVCCCVLHLAHGMLATGDPFWLPRKEVEFLDHSLWQCNRLIPARMIRLMSAQQVHDLRQIFKVETKVLTVTHS